MSALVVIDRQLCSCANARTRAQDLAGLGRLEQAGPGRHDGPPVAAPVQAEDRLAVLRPEGKAHLVAEMEGLRHAQRSRDDPRHAGQRRRGLPAGSRCLARNWAG